MVKHNNVVPNAHFHKKWQQSSRGPLKVKLMLDQAGKKKSRRVKRAAKAAAMAPLPIDKLRPAVHAQTQRYNAKVKLGRGFSISELKAAGLTATYARTIGIAVDARRTNKSEDAMAVNVDRLKTYISSIVIFDKKKSSAAIATATQFKGTVMPIAKPAAAVVMEDVVVPEESSFIQMRKARKENKIDGQRHAAAERKKKE
eukprot:CAMPEP_0182498652 /NCGR_PEP_ID=MMETSP1321-20130603/6790_1 /TAXON_ID=91990 /ORGANISM="Bolidomonas sp., Strain RCC1657" /LENGTH=199 /DNA_ID=CAMNT_0024702737 /DNA_START=40 /DNA_END=639 /DNA_ORIENTATION=+